MFLKKYLMIFAVALTMTFSANAQDAPRDVSDLVGALAPGGETQLQRRGYQFINSTRGDDRTYSNWWKASTRVCIAVATMNGRFNSITKTPAPDCNQNTNSGGGSSSGGGGNREVNVNDLVGSRAPGGESELQRRGFRLVDSAKGNQSYNHWFRSRSRQCIMVVTSDGRFSDIVPSKTSECR